MVFKLPMLKYEYNALEPYVDTLTMSIHHSMEHEVYVQYTNEYVEKVRLPPSSTISDNFCFVVSNSNSACTN